MQITLKQIEIEQALKKYLTDQGIAVHGKKVSVAFTAGRRESGISAEVSIEDVPMPDFLDMDGDEEAEATPPIPSVRPGPPESEPEPEVPDAAASDEEEPAPKVTNSLFG